MKKLLGIVLTVIVIFALLAGLGLVKHDFSLVKYLEGFGNVQDFPSLPDFYVGDGNFFEQAVNFFIFVGNVLAYPFYFLVYVFDVVKVVFGGLTL